MPINTALMGELKHEAANTRKMIERVPSDKLEWRPHEKSMTIGRIATHIADIPVWFKRIISADEFDFSTAIINRETKENTEAILRLFDEKLQEAINLLEAAADERLMHYGRYGAAIMYFLNYRKK